MGVWNVDLRGGDKQTPSMTLRCLGAGHKGEVSCLAVDPKRQFVCTGSWDNSAKLWPLDASALDDADVVVADASSSGGGQNKRQRTGQDGKATTTSVRKLKPSAEFEGHKGPVTGVAWASTRSLFTGSHDHNIVSWDVTGGNPNVERAIAWQVVDANASVFLILSQP